MDIFSIAEAKTNLSELVEQAANGQAFIIAKDGKPMVKVVPIKVAATLPGPQIRRIGFMKGMFTTPDDFDTMMADEIEEMFYGKPDKK